MSGSNIILKTGDVLFKEGDSSDGMYLIRKGEILIYLENGGNQIKLANITAGAMIGEMALFDRKPRSAAAKAIAETEVTKISEDDFKKIMKQIPKWFVSLMVSLSTRLRETNERLQNMEGKSSGSAKPLENIVKVNGVFNLLWHKDGTKEQKSWLLDREPAEDEISTVLGIDKAIVHKIIDGYAKSSLIGIKPNSYKKDVCFVPNKGVIEKFGQFLQYFLKNFSGKKSISDVSIELLTVLCEIAFESAYEVVTVPLDELTKEGERRSLDTDKWKDCLAELKSFGDGMILTKVSNGIGFKVDRKIIKVTISHYKILQALNKAGVA